MNQELEQYLRMFIDHQQEQWPEWLGTAEFTYNNKVQTSTKVSPFKVNAGRDPRMGFELRKKGKFEEANKFVERIQEIQGEAKAALSKAQEDMKKYADRHKEEVEEYKVGDLVLLSTKDLKYQMVGRRTEKLTERFIGPYKVKSIVLTNAIELELPSCQDPWDNPRSPSEGMRLQTRRTRQSSLYELPSYLYNYKWLC